MVGDEEVVSLSRAKVHVFSDYVLCLGKMSENPIIKYCLGNKLTWFESSSQYRSLDTIDGASVELYFQDSPHCRGHLGSSHFCSSRRCSRASTGFSFCTLVRRGLMPRRRWIETGGYRSSAVLVP